MLGVEVFPLEYQMAIIAVYRISWPARKPSFHSFKAVAFKLPRNVQCICPSGMAALDSFFFEVSGSFGFWCAGEWQLDNWSLFFLQQCLS